MSCTSCGRANRPGARFCGGCGKPLAPRCPACGAECEPGGDGPLRRREGLDGPRRAARPRGVARHHGPLLPHPGRRQSAAPARRRSRKSAETVALRLEARISWLNYGWRLGISHEEAEGVFNEAERMASKAGDIGSRVTLLSVYGIVR